MSIPRTLSMAGSVFGDEDYGRSKWAVAVGGLLHGSSVLVDRFACNSTVVSASAAVPVPHNM